ncbi:hypothetical protein X798_01984 [Onchocerca flexuosa]|uniref:DDE-1 domain-containing protein n=2 Tax=Onchocerca flexuosa TaxID=387005 RepID=A0A183I7I8_9BILA|nr:hypothetical protein X798_05543 [Onchocerca flexuosa]OZC11158.1 hypothetical protein X798_01984 [Onchocerca flexuosa]VDP23305.1 unnamed protein product [Onchocerca flexuosa]
MQSSGCNFVMSALICVTDINALQLWGAAPNVAEIPLDLQTFGYQICDNRQRAKNVSVVTKLAGGVARVWTFEQQRSWYDVNMRVEEKVNDPTVEEY